MSLDNFEVIGTIGEGAFGKVTKVKRKSDGEVLVWKELHYGKMSEKEKQLLVSEVNILRELNNPHIVRYHDRIIAREQKKIYIVMEFCSGGDLASGIKQKQKEGKYFDEEAIWKVFAEVAFALHECHRKQNGRVLHRDLKPGNIFFDAANNVKLGDFGLARVLAESSMFAQTHVGTPYYMSPEQVKESKYNEKSDIWSFGCLIYEMAALVPPFRAANQLALAVKIQQGKFAELPQHYSKELERALRCMIQVCVNACCSVYQTSPLFAAWHCFSPFSPSPRNLACFLPPTFRSNPTSGPTLSRFSRFRALRCGIARCV